MVIICDSQMEILPLENSSLKLLNQIQKVYLWECIKILKEIFIVDRLIHF